MHQERRQPRSFWLVEPTGRYRLDSNGQQLDRGGQVPSHHHRLKSLAGAVRVDYVREFVERSARLDCSWPGEDQVRAAWAVESGRSDVKGCSPARLQQGSARRAAVISAIVSVRRR
jgi:hypothetical protein